MKRIGLAVLAIVVMAFLGLAFFPAPAFEPPARDLADESVFDLAHKVGWYRLEDGSSRLLTWGAQRGLALYGFGATRDDLRRSVFYPTSALSFRSPGPPPERALEFVLAPDQSIVEARLWTPTDTLSLTPERGPYQTHEVTFDSGTIQLSGLLFVPEGEGPFPGAVFIHGSGSSDRDSFWYLSPADYLARRGIAVLLPDKRGSGKSGGEWHVSSFNELARDAEGARALLAAHPLVDGSRVGLVGFSQGGWIAPLAANGSPT